MAAPDSNAAQRKRRWLRQMLGIAISAICLWLIARRVQLDELRDTAGRLDWRLLALGLASLGAGYAMRIRRWAVMLRATGTQVGSRACAAPFLGSIALNNVLPFRAGDVVRALVFPASLGVRRITAAASLLLERLLDLLVLLLCLSVGLSLDVHGGLPQWLGEGAVMLSLSGGAALAVLIGCRPLLAKALSHLREARPRSRAAMYAGVAHDFIQHLGDMSRPSMLLSLFALSLAVWGGEAGLFWALLSALGLQAGLASALLVMAMATLSTLVPSSPGYVGPFHLAAFSAVAMQGGTPGQAAGFAVLAHLAVWLPTTLAGSIAILANPGLFNARASVP